MKILLLNAKLYCCTKKVGLASDWEGQPFWVIFELPHLKHNHEQKLHISTDSRYMDN